MQEFILLSTEYMHSFNKGIIKLFIYSSAPLVIEFTDDTIDAMRHHLRAINNTIRLF